MSQAKSIVEILADDVLDVIGAGLEYFSKNALGIKKRVRVPDVRGELINRLNSCDGEYARLIGDLKVVNYVGLEQLEEFVSSLWKKCDEPELEFDQLLENAAGNQGLLTELWFRIRKVFAGEIRAQPKLLFDSLREVCEQPIPRDARKQTKFAAENLATLLRFLAWFYLHSIDKPERSKLILDVLEKKPEHLNGEVVGKSCWAV